MHGVNPDEENAPLNTVTLNNMNDYDGMWYTEEQVANP